MPKFGRSGGKRGFIFNKPRAAPYVVRKVDHCLFWTWPGGWRENIQGWLQGPCLKQGEGYTPDNTYAYNAHLNVDTEIVFLVEYEALENTFFFKNRYNIAGFNLTVPQRESVEDVVTKDFHSTCDFMETHFNPCNVKGYMHALLVAETPTMKAFLGLFSGNALITKVEKTCVDNLWEVNLSATWIQYPGTRAVHNCFEVGCQWHKRMWDAAGSLEGLQAQSFSSHDLKELIGTLNSNREKDVAQQVDALAGVLEGMSVSPENKGTVRSGPLVW